VNRIRRWRLTPSARGSQVAALTVLAVLLYVGAAAGLSAIPGYDEMRHTLAGVRWAWVLASLGGVVAAFVGYLLAWRGVARGAGAGGSLSRRQRLAAVTAGFGGFIGRGGSAVDRYAMLASGMDEREADVRLAGLDALEHTPLAIGCCAAAFYLICTGRTDPPPLDFVWPWAVGPLLGAALVIPAVIRYRRRFREAHGWRRYLGIGLDSVALLGKLVKDPKCGLFAFGGMTLFWVGEMFALWAGLAAFGTRASIPILILADAVGYVLSRRTAPLGGAGFIDTFLALCLWDCNVPLAAAIAGVFTYRFFSLFAVLPFSFAALPALRSIGGPDASPSPEPAMRSAPGRPR
jgi:uncharacterized membrane protein YbhN (UPF0104 family)